MRRSSWWRCPVPNAIEIRGLTKRYGALWAVNDLSLDIPEGSVFGLIGPNGAGKSTTFSVLAGLLKPSGGTVSVLGFDPAKAPREVKRRLGYMPDVLGHYDALTVREYLEFFCAAYNVPRSRMNETIAELLELVELDVKVDASVNDLSRGMKQRLSLARALVHDPQVLILDEPASGLDPRARIELRALLVQLAEMGKTLVVSSHILADLQEICTDVAIMEAGKVLASGPPQAILEGFDSQRRAIVRFLDGTEESFEVADEAAQAELIRRLVVDDGRQVVGLYVESKGLEQIFMQVTEGIVQ